jgi:hypothetical protein
MLVATLLMALAASTPSKAPSTSNPPPKAPAPADAKSATPPKAAHHVAPLHPVDRVRRAKLDPSLVRDALSSLPRVADVVGIAADRLAEPMVLSLSRAAVLGSRLYALGMTVNDPLTGDIIFFNDGSSVVRVVRIELDVEAGSRYFVECVGSDNAWDLRRSTVVGDHVTEDAGARLHLAATTRPAWGFRAEQTGSAIVEFEPRIALHRDGFVTSCQIVRVMATGAP